jgi:hypothetical protein
VTDLVKRDDSAVQQVEPTNLLHALMVLAKDKDFDADKLERVLQMQERMEQRQRQQVFDSALARLQAELPSIAKHGVSRNGKYAKYEDIHEVIKPLLKKYGFSLSFDSQPFKDNWITLTCRLAHEDGHREEKSMPLPIDDGKSKDGRSLKSPPQEVGSTIQYGRRYLTKMHLNIVETDEDTNAEDIQTIDEEQARDIEAMLTEVKGDKAGFLRYMGVASIGEILQRDHKKAVESLNAKRRSMK